LHIKKYKTKPSASHDHNVLAALGLEKDETRWWYGHGKPHYYLPVNLEVGQLVVKTTRYSQPRGMSDWIYFPLSIFRVSRRWPDSHLIDVDLEQLSPEVITIPDKHIKGIDHAHFEPLEDEDEITMLVLATM